MRKREFVFGRLGAPLHLPVLSQTRQVGNGPIWVLSGRWVSAKASRLPAKAAILEPAFRGSSTPTKAHALRLD